LFSNLERGTNKASAQAVDKKRLVKNKRKYFID